MIIQAKAAVAGAALLASGAGTGWAVTDATGDDGWRVSERYSAVRVHRGDTLTAIARRSGSSVAEMLRLNPQIANPDLIRVGDQVRVP